METAQAQPTEAMPEGGQLETPEVTSQAPEEATFDSILQPAVDRIEGVVHEEQAPEPGQPPEPEQTLEVTTPEPEPEIKAPDHWPEAQKQAFSSLTPEAKQSMLEQSKWLEAGATRKFQEAAQLRQEAADRLARYEELMKQQTAPVPQVEESDDPIEVIKREATNAALEKLKAEQAREFEERRKLEHNRAIQQIMEMKRTDPMHNEVQAQLDNFVDSLPLREQQVAFRNRLNNDPFAYGQMYQHYRTQLLQAQAVAEKQTQPEPTPAPQATPSAATRTTHAPVLEQGTGDAHIPPTDAGEKKRKKLLYQIKRGTAGNDPVGQFLETFDYNV